MLPDEASVSVYKGEVKYGLCSNSILRDRNPTFEHDHLHAFSLVNVKNGAAVNEITIN